MGHPYRSLPPRSFWSSGVAEASAGELSDVYRKRFEIAANARIGSAGSCFGQHIGRRLRARGLHFLDMEPAPRLLPTEQHARFGYGVYSARYGNVYTARQLHQLVRRARGELVPVDSVWEHEGRFYDPYRPTIEPGGFGSAEEVIALRAAHLRAVLELFRRCDVFVVTLGLTEAWCFDEDGVVYPVCPGTVAGRFDPARHRFSNFGFREVYEDLRGFLRAARELNPSIRFVLTVSPVPLVASASGEHVLSATTYSKSVLRAVCGELLRELDFVDYFPSYELIASHAARARFFAADLRSVTPEGVDYVMSHFFAAHDAAPTTASSAHRDLAWPDARDRAAIAAVGDECDEARLDAQGRPPC